MNKKKNKKRKKVQQDGKKVNINKEDKNGVIDKKQNIDTSEKDDFNMQKKNIKNWRKIKDIIIKIIVFIGFSGFISMLNSCANFKEKEREQQQSSINYSLELTQNYSILRQFRDNIQYSLFPFKFSLNKENKSGEFDKIYIAKIINGKPVIKEIPKNLVYTYLEVDYLEVENGDSQIDSNYIEIGDETIPENGELNLDYLDFNSNDYIFMFHILLFGYDDSYQIFSVINYSAGIEKSESINDVIFESEFITFNSEIIDDISMYDDSIIHKITDTLNKVGIETNPYESYADLQNQIIEERNLIKNAIEK